MIRLGRPARGFTLIEIMIVVAIVAILAAILVPNTVKSRAQAKRTACAQNVKGVATGVELYRNDNNGKLPLQNQLTMQQLAGGATAGDMINNLSELSRYMPLNLRCPTSSRSSGSDYLYALCSTSAQYSYLVRCDATNTGGGHAFVGSPAGYPAWSGGSNWYTMKPGLNLAP